MTDIQSKLLVLMDEIKEICEKEKLSYIVSGLSYAYIINHKSFEDEQGIFDIMMPLKDALKLEKYVNNDKNEDRIVESWNNNPDLQMLYFRYVDNTTLFIEGNSAERRKYQGIHINIYPTREFEPSNDVRGIERYIQLLNYKQEKFAGKIIAYKFLTRVTHMERFKAHIMRKIKLDNANYIHHGYLNRKKMNKQEMINFVFDANLKATKPFKTKRYLPKDIAQNEGSEGENCLAYMDERSHVYKLPISLYTDVSETEFEGKKFRVYNKKEDYFSTLYGTDWKNKVEEEIPGTSMSSVIADAEIPYEEYFEYIKDDKTTLDDICENKLKYNYWMGQVYNPAVNKTWHTYMMVRRSVERIDIWYKLRKKREALKKAYDEKDIAKLKKILSGYIKTTEKYRAEKIGFYIDDELFKFARLIWDNGDYPEYSDGEGNKLSYPDYIYSLVPELYKSETPDQYFAKRGKTFE